MQHLIDNFPPGELLHIVSVANKHQLLTTEDKRYLIALRMSAPYTEGRYQINDSKKQEFPRVFEEFLTQLESHAGCGEESCSICSRFHVLKSHAEAARNSEPQLEYSQLSSYTMEPDEEEHARPEDISISQARTKMALKRREERLARVNENRKLEGQNRKKVKVKVKRGGRTPVEQTALHEQTAPEQSQQEPAAPEQSAERTSEPSGSAVDTFDIYALQESLENAVSVDIESLSARKLMDYAEESKRLMALAAEFLRTTADTPQEESEDTDWAENRRMYARDLAEEMEESLRTATA